MKMKYSGHFQHDGNEIHQQSFDRMINIYLLLLSIDNNYLIDIDIPNESIFLS